MKKWLSAMMILMVALFVVACGSDKSADKEKKEESKQEQKAEKKDKKPKEKSDEKESSTAKSNEEKANDSSSESKDTTTKEDTNKSEPSTNKNESKSSKQTPAKQTIAAPQISKSAFMVSNVEPITGGKVTTVYGSYSPTFIKDFGSLTIRVNQYKVEKVEKPTKKIDQYSPESSIQNGGYVVTIDFSIFNQTNENLTYKPEQISLAGNSSVTGGSLDNFVPAKYKIKGSTSDPYVFAPGKTAEGFVTYILDDAKFEDLKSNPRLAVPNPSKMDNKAVKGDDEIATFKVQ
ncbi:DUF5068 domain-containing protein [Listeria aquatica]|uniref:DUF5068 domain-containing protein n=1 Tax=Listeria aquatica TaxID=1494960 RepID=A0A841ZKN5_9LIST|nr:DUF5068 domain-containing protein [Listeria aquatica]MBC1520663.1 DUF5068 domain-containing protein [Listeria aquatica]